MARATFVTKSRKAPGACSKCGTKIKKGQSYYWWKFRYGGRYIRCSKTECAPKASDLTQSAFYSTLYGIQESIEQAMSSEDKDTIVDALRQAAEDLRALGEECEENRGNMPEQLQDSEKGELLQTRKEECDSKADELESSADELDGADMLDPEEWKSYAEDNAILKEHPESDEDFEKRIRELMEEENNSTLEVDVDISID